MDPVCMALCPTGHVGVPWGWLETLAREGHTPTSWSLASVKDVLVTADTKPRLRGGDGDSEAELQTAVRSGPHGLAGKRTNRRAVCLLPSRGGGGWVDMGSAALTEQQTGSRWPICPGRTEGKG